MIYYHDDINVNIWDFFNPLHGKKSSLYKSSSEVV